MSEKTKLEIELEYSECKKSKKGYFFFKTILFLTVIIGVYCFYLKDLELRRTKISLGQLSSKYESLKIESSNQKKQIELLKEKIKKLTSKEAVEQKVADIDVMSDYHSSRESNEINTPGD